MIRQQKPAPTRGLTGRGASGIQSCFSCALHMHQPTIPAGRDNGLISHLHMFEHPGEGDNHNADAFASCYRRMADLIPELISEGCNPKIMLDYSGNLLWGFEQMQRNDILEALKYLTCDLGMQNHVEWLGTFWGHRTPPTPAPDLEATHHGLATTLFGIIWRCCAQKSPWILIAGNESSQSSGQLICINYVTSGKWL